MIKTEFYLKVFDIMEKFNVVAVKNVNILNKLNIVLRLLKLIFKILFDL